MNGAKPRIQSAKTTFGYQGSEQSLSKVVSHAKYRPMSAAMPAKVTFFRKNYISKNDIRGNSAAPKTVIIPQNEEKSKLKVGEYHIVLLKIRKYEVLR